MTTMLDRIDTELRPLAQPLFHFDPDAVGALFAPITRSMTLAYRHVPERVIAPVPNKAPRLVEPFVRYSYVRANAAVAQSERLVAIGYSFNEHDRASYDPILSVVGKRALSIVSPDAIAVATRLTRQYPDDAVSCDSLDVYRVGRAQIPALTLHPGTRALRGICFTSSAVKHAKGCPSG